MRVLLIGLIGFSISFESFAMRAEGSAEQEAQQIYASKVILQKNNESGQTENVCVAETAGHPELAPSFVKAPPFGYESTAPINLPTCTESEVRVVASNASRAVLNQKTAIAHLLILGGVACVVGAVTGVTFQFITAPYHRPKASDDFMFYGMTMASGAGLAHVVTRTTGIAMDARTFFPMGPTFLVGAFCAGTSMALTYVFESWKAGTPLHPSPGPQ